MKQQLRIGKISSVNTAQATVRVLFDDREQLVSDDIPVLQMGAGDDIKSYALPQVGEQVACLFGIGGAEDGVCLGSIYTSENLPTDAGPLIALRWGGGYIIVNTNNNTVTIAASGGVSIVGGLSVTGNISSGGDVMTNDVSLNNHTHSGGNHGSPTGPPI